VTEKSLRSYQERVKERQKVSFAHLPFNKQLLPEGLEGVFTMLEIKKKVIQKWRKFKSPI
jgi:hypothetical protein